MPYLNVKTYTLNENNMNNNTDLTNALTAFMQILTGGNDSEETTGYETELDVEDTDETVTESIEVILQSQRKQPSRETLTQLVGSASTFVDLRTQLFQSSTARGIGVTVTLDGTSTTYSESDRIPGGILDATQVRISYSVESGKNGHLVLA